MTIRYSYLLILMVLLPVAYGQSFIYFDQINLTTAQNTQTLCFNNETNTSTTIQTGTITLTYHDATAPGYVKSTTIDCNANTTQNTILVSRIKDFNCTVDEIQQNLSMAAQAMQNSTIAFATYWDQSKYYTRNCLVDNLTKEQCLRTLEFERNETAIEINDTKNRLVSCEEDLLAQSTKVCPVVEPPAKPLSPLIYVGGTAIIMYLILNKGKGRSAPKPYESRHDKPDPENVDKFFR